MRVQIPHPAPRDFMVIINKTENIEPAMEAIDGIKYDFIDGLNIRFPEKGGPWKIVIKDLDTDTVLCNEDVSYNTRIIGKKKFFIRYGIKIYNKYASAPIWEHSYNAENKTVMINMNVSTLGDNLGWIPYVEKFRIKHNCKIIAVMKQAYIDLLQKSYPEIQMVTKADIKKYKPYAFYYIGIWVNDNGIHQPCDYRLVGTHRNVAYVLGVDPEEEKPRLDLSHPRTIPVPYVCIATKASGHEKEWNNPYGWYDVVHWLKDYGYQVLCIDKEPITGRDGIYNYIPHGCTDLTGNIPLQDRVNILKDADFFIGLPSGLSWLAWACNIPVVIISGFSHPTTEFYTPYRVINYLVCNSCWNDMRETFDRNYFWCPRNKNFECTRKISSKQVIDMIKTIPTLRRTSHAPSY